jgi:23S rRNA (uracil1939-C5)-methyltransferase
MTVLKAEEAVYGGYVIAKAEGVVFIRGAIPGELVSVSVDEKKKDYSVASVTGIIEPSEARIEPHCRYFGDCGGCQLQFVSYEKQIEMKNHVLLDCLRRIGGVEIELAPSLSGRQLNYRSRAQMKVSKAGVVGFFREGTIEVVEVGECPLLVDELNEALIKLRDIDLQGIRELHLTAGDGVIALARGTGFNAPLADKFIEMGFSGVAFDDGSFRGSGPGYVNLDLNGLKYTVSPWSFFQSNWDLNCEAVKLLTEGIGPMQDKRLLDLYAGGGNFSMQMALDASETVAVEENPSSIADGKRNRSANRIPNYKFVKGTAEGAKLEGAFDVVILDPPRPGLTKEAMGRVLEMAPERIAYVSCNPSTFARDLKRMADAYEISSVCMIDLFPNTYHLEALAFLHRK